MGTLLAAMYDHGLSGSWGPVRSTTTSLASANCRRCRRPDRDAPDAKPGDPAIQPASVDETSPRWSASG